MFTRSSVVCAARIVAQSNSSGFECRSAQSSGAPPGYSAASRTIVSRARPFGDLGPATAKTVPSPFVPTINRTPRTWVVYSDRDDLGAALAQVKAGGGGPVRWFVTDPVDADELV